MSELRRMRKVAALERSDNVADRGHAFAMLKRGYTRRIPFGLNVIPRDQDV